MQLSQILGAEFDTRAQIVIQGILGLFAPARKRGYGQPTQFCARASGGGGGLFMSHAPRFIPIALAFVVVTGYALALALVPDAQARQDTDAPIVVPIPANDATRGNDQPIRLIFTEPVYSDSDATVFSTTSARALITLKRNGPSGSDIAIASTTIDKDNRMIVASPQTNLPNGKVYIAVAGDFYDAAGNRGVAASATFTAVTPPTAATGLIVEARERTLYEGSGRPVTMRVRLATEPTGNVTVTVIPSGNANANGSGVACDPANAHDLHKRWLRDRQ